MENQGQGFQPDQIPLDHVKQLLDSISSAEELLNSHELFEYCAALDDISFCRAKNAVREKAIAFRCRTDAIDTLFGYRRAAQKDQTRKQLEITLARRTTTFFPDGDDVETDDAVADPVLIINPWVCSQEGISRQMEKGGLMEICHQAVFPNRIFRNIESDILKVELMYGHAGNYHSITVDKVTISKASTITELASHGLDISSETAKNMVAYLQDIEAVNRRADRLRVVDTTSKFGWGPVGTEYEKTFVPYDLTLEFDGAGNFRELFRSIQEKGSMDKWLKKAKEIRAGETVPPRVALAASFASVLVGQLRINPFIVDFWGVTERGKTVLLMLAASIWADPTVGRFITTFRSTNAGFEVLVDALNSLPLILDDSSNASQWLDFEGLVYSLCEGSGKTRSNKSLGRQRQTNWRNSILTNGERPLHRMVKQGGAINRILEVDCNRVKLFEDPRQVCKVIQANYGHAGRAFVDALRQMDPETMTEIFEEKLTALPEKAMEKQRQAVACILLADELATRWIFQDGKALTPDELSEFLTVPDEVSEGQRAYQYLCDVVSMYQDNFREDNPGKTTLWGKIDDQNHRVYFFRTALDEQLKKGGYDINVLINWCKVNDLLIHATGRNSMTQRINIFEDGKEVLKVVRVICIEMNRTILPSQYE